MIMVTINISSCDDIDMINESLHILTIGPTF
jgi:hypothetical protein